MSLRDRIEAKDPRRVKVRVRISDPDPDLARLAEARAFLLAAATDPDRDTTAEQDAVAAAEAAVASHTEDVWFQQLTPGRFDEVWATYARGGDDVDRMGLCAALAAECAVDESVQDLQWWAAQLADDGKWAPGERDGLYHQLLNELHLWVPAGAYSKG